MWCNARLGSEVRAGPVRGRLNHGVWFEAFAGRAASDARGKLIANLRLALANNIPAHLIQAATRNIVTDCSVEPLEGAHVSLEGEHSDAPAPDSDSLDCGQSDPTPPHPTAEISDASRTLA